MIPKYIILKEELNKDILSNKYPLGSKLPTEMELSKLYNLSRSTVRQALELLESQGIIEKKWGSGNIVIAKSDNSKADTVMVLLPEDKSNYYSTLLSDISAYLLKNSLTVEFHTTGNAYQAERDHLSVLLKDMYAGVIIMMAHSSMPSPNTDIIQQLLKRQVPIVFIDKAPDALYNPLVVAADYYDKGYKEARTLINQGHKKIGGIFLQDSYRSRQCFLGFMDAIRDASLPMQDNCFLWINQQDSVGINQRSSASLNRFLKGAYNICSAIYSDDDTLPMDGTFPVFTSSLVEARSLGKECALTLIDTLKNGNGSSVTISYKAI